MYREEAKEFMRRRFPLELAKDAEHKRAVERKMEEWPGFQDNHYRYFESIVDGWLAHYPSKADNVLE